MPSKTTEAVFTITFTFQMNKFEVSVTKSGDDYVCYIPVFNKYISIQCREKNTKRVWVNKGTGLSDSFIATLGKAIENAGKAKC